MNGGGAGVDEYDEDPDYPPDVPANDEVDDGENKQPVPGNVFTMSTMCTMYTTYTLYALYTLYTFCTV